MSGDDLIDDIELEYADNPTPRLPCILIVDGSTSMLDNNAIGELNAGLERFAEEIKSDPQVAASARLKVLRIGETIDTLVDWTDAMNFTAPAVEANGRTPLGLGVTQALKEIEEEKRRLDDAEIVRKRAWLFILTDGYPTDHGWEKHAEACALAEEQGQLSVFPIGVDGADMGKLAKFTKKREPRHMSSGNFSEFFLWLTRSIAVGTSDANPAADSAEPVQSSEQQKADDSWLFAG